MLAKVKYKIATYSGSIEVPCNENDEDEIIKTKAKKIVKRRFGGDLPFFNSQFERYYLLNDPKKAAVEVEIPYNKY